MIRDDLKSALVEALKEQGVEAKGVELTRPADAKNGDYSANAALKFSHEASQSPMEFARILADSLRTQPQIEKLEVKEPGFLNIFVKDLLWQEEVEKVLSAGKKYGSNEAGRGKKARVEFVSANPTGPLHFGNARGGPIGDTLASVLEFSGYSVIREYLHNDIGGQVDKLGQSIVNVAAGKKLGEQEYKGWYVENLAREIKAADPKEAGKKAVEKMLAVALENCKALGIKFDEVHSESEMVENGRTKAVLDQLQSKNVLKKKEGATWFAPSDEFLKDRETVVVKSDGSYTYFADDIAYHSLKFKVDPDLVVDIFGADHHGHVPRLKAAVSALGYDVSKFHVILYQWVRFKKGEELLKTSKRSGNIVTVSDVLKAIGPDAVRFFILMHDANSPIDFDLDLAKEKSAKNPVYYVQYAHARIASILEKAGTKGQKSEANNNLLTNNYELNLIKQVSRLPELVEDVSRNFAVNALTAYARELADSFHKFYENCRVVGEEKELEQARISLVSACKITLENTLGLLGVSAPEKM